MQKEPEIGQKGESKGFEASNQEVTFFFLSELTFYL